MQIYKNSAFCKWANDNNIEDHVFSQVVHEVKDGLFDANLGGNVYKKRLPLDGKGKRGGARTILAFKKQDKVFFLYALKKNKQASVTPKELQALKSLAKLYFSLSDKQLKQAVENGVLFKVEDNNG